MHLSSTTFQKNWGIDKQFPLDANYRCMPGSEISLDVKTHRKQDHLGKRKT